MDLAIILTCYIVFVYSTVCHEAAHAWVAYKLGDSTAYLGGQVSLDPIPHIKREPIGMVVAPLVALFSFGGLIGWASAPLDAMWVARHPRRSAMVAMAGPLANICLCIAAVLVMFIGAKNGVFLPSGSMQFHEFVRGAENTSWELIAQVVSVVFSLNLLLAILNLMPIPPLDGSNIPLFFLKGNASEQYQNAMRQPWMILITMVLVFKLFPMIFEPAYLQSKVTLFRWFFT